MFYSIRHHRLLGMYKYEEQTNGKIAASMLRVTWNFCRTRLMLSAVFRILAWVAIIVGITVFGTNILMACDAEMTVGKLNAI